MAYTTAPTNLFKMHFVDYAGRPATFECRVDASELDPAGGACAAIATAAAACSDDALVSQEIIVVGINDAPGVAADGPYQRGADKANFVFTTAAGTEVKIQVGAPLAAILSTGHVYVDPVQTDVAAFIAGMIANASDADGEGIVAFKRGYRRRPPRRKHA
jgi:hypothetical protein